VQAALRASDEIAAALQAHLTQEHGAHVVAREVFAELGSPGGAARAPKVPDLPFVVALPPQEHDEV
jgi:hypothetical protein